MFSQKVPGMTVRHSNGRAYGNPHLITFNVGPMRAQILVSSSLPICWKNRHKAPFGIIRISAVALDLVFFMAAKCVPVRPIFKRGKSQKSF